MTLRTQPSIGRRGDVGHEATASRSAGEHDATAPRTSSGNEAAHEHIVPDARTPDLAGRTPTDTTPSNITTNNTTTSDTTTSDTTANDTKFKLSLNVVFPLLGGRSTWTHEHLLPVFVSLIVALMLFTVPFTWLQLPVGDKPAPPGITEAWQVFAILGIYIAFLINYYINQMCGRPRSGWLQALVSVIMFWLLTTPFWDYCYDFFYVVIPAQSLEKSSNPLAVIGGNIFGTGLAEEGFKALPLIALALMTLAFTALSSRTTGRLSAFLCGTAEHFGLREPLDGIVLGAASGSGFFIYETLAQYVPQVIDASKGNMAFNGLVQLLARGIPQLTAHSAYAGLFGYFIGLSVLRPGMAVFLIPLGWLSAAALHGAWDAASQLVVSSLIGVPVHVVIGVLSYALLAGAIFKARDISPSFVQRCFKIRCADLAA
jgi:RsiW-degrading membrane proteinase PrsW (M82 family)